MPWITPKTDWTGVPVMDNIEGLIQGDRFSASEEYNQAHFGRNSDWHRIKGNIEYLRDYANHLISGIIIEEIPDINYTVSCTDNADSIAKTGKPALPTPDVVNTIENSLQILMDATAAWDWENSVPRRANGTSWDYADLNRIESMTLKLYEFMLSAHIIRPTIKFVCGGGFFATYLARHDS